MINQRQFCSEENKKIVRAKDALGRLRANHTDAVAVMALYETCGRELQEVAFRSFGKNQLGKKAVLNLLVAVTLHAASYDPESMDATEWVRRCANAEARRLRETLDATGSTGRQIGRAM